MTRGLQGACCREAEAGQSGHVLYLEVEAGTSAITERVEIFDHARLSPTQLENYFVRLRIMMPFACIPNHGGSAA